MRRLKNYQTERSNPRRFAVLKVTAKQAAVARHSYPPEGIASKLIVDKACDRLGRPERRPFSISPPMSAPNVICAQFKIFETALFDRKSGTFERWKRRGAGAKKTRDFEPRGRSLVG